MRTLVHAFAAFGRFWYSFVIGDDWVAAAGVALLIGGAYGLQALGISFWWWGPTVVLGTGTLLVHRALTRRAASSSTESA